MICFPHPWSQCGSNALHDMLGKQSDPSATYCTVLIHHERINKYARVPRRYDTFLNIGSYFPLVHRLLSPWLKLAHWLKLTPWLKLTLWLRLTLQDMAINPNFCWLTAIFLAVDMINTSRSAVLCDQPASSSGNPEMIPKELKYTHKNKTIDDHWKY